MKQTCYVPELQSDSFSLEIIENFQAKIAPNGGIHRYIEFIITVLI